jgi:predicted Zn-dependent peptidase
MLNELLGGSPSSKLFLNVRERMSLCYFCSSSFSIYTGAIMVSCGIEPSNYSLAKNAILDQFEEIKKGNVSDFELSAAQKSISNSYLQLYDSPFDIQSFYSGRRFFGVDDEIEECLKKLMAVTKEQIKDLASSISLDAEFFIEGTEANGDDEEDFENE